MADNVIRFPARQNEPEPDDPEIEDWGHADCTVCDAARIQQRKTNSEPRADFAVWHCVGNCGAIVSSPGSMCLTCSSQDTE